MSTDTLPSETPSVQDIYGYVAGFAALPDSPALEQELSDDQRAALECFYADDDLTDADIDRMYAESQQAFRDAELEAQAAAFMAMFRQYVEAVLEADAALVEQQAYTNAAVALEVA